MVENYIDLFRQIYFSAVAFHIISFVLGFFVIFTHGDKFRASSPSEIFKSPVEWVYIVTVFSTIGNCLIILALVDYVMERRIGFMPGQKELLFAFYHSLEGLTVIGWHITSFFIMKLYGRQGG